MARPAASAATARSDMAAIGAHFGISQTTLAAYLGISQPLIALAGSKQRQLPTVALLRLLPLYQALPPPWGIGAADTATPEPLTAAVKALPHLPDPADFGPLQRRLLACEAALLGATRALARAEHPAAQARRLLAVLPALAATLPPDDARAQRQLPFMEANARDHLGPGPVAKRALLTIRVAALRHEIAWLRAWLPVE
ncbi:MAG: hypothetical protein H7330_13755 [Hymenobacteraceae bacterium]|nr:hypothetical protein [Hymenobacteraceae bacterium]